MARGLRMLLALGALMVLAQVESPPYGCDDGEYYNSGICCKNCPAGTYVYEPCDRPLTAGHCTACTEGKDYTAHENGLDACLPCDVCKSDTTVVKPCTVKSNTHCQCKDGYYCPPGCEECLQCKKMCPKGQVTVQNCNATADMKCGPPPTETSHTDNMLILYVVVVVAAAASIVIGICTCICCKKRCVPWRKEEKSDNNDLSADSTDDLLPSRKNSNIDALPTKSQEVDLSFVDPASVSSYSDLPGSINLSHAKEASNSGAAPLLQLTDKPVTSNVPSNVLASNAECSAMIKPSELSRICEELTNNVLVRDWKMFMRNAGLSNNEIDIMTHDYPSDTREQKYRMLQALCDRFVPDIALCKLLNGLQQTKLTHIYDNLQNELLSKNIKIVEEKGKCAYFVKNAEHNL
ncbi:tumor necrosis factor receptor superfamily member 10A-like [Paroedura picta]|uniref:tumor necrosis factor receptor superfamily member 10A-like n=1 Tax=Paroedura picta TaxID=143630 RepID=UPI004055D293